MGLCCEFDWQHLFGYLLILFHTPDDAKFTVVDRLYQEAYCTHFLPTTAGDVLRSFSNSNSDKAEKMLSVR